MAKLNKSETERAAHVAANNNTDVAAMTVTEIQRLSYDERRQLARDYAKNAAENLRVETRYPDEFLSAYESRVLSIWGGKVQQLENARRNWKRAASGLTLEQAEAKLKAALEAMHIRGARVDSYHSVTVARDGSGWGGPTLRWTFERDYDAYVTNPDDSGQRAGVYALRFEISTSGSSYSLAEMGLLNKIHAELLDAANELTVVMARERIIWTYGIPDEAVATAADAMVPLPEEEVAR